MTEQAQVTVINRTRQTRIIRGTVGGRAHTYRIQRGTRAVIPAAVWEEWSSTPGAAEVVASHTLKAVPVRGEAAKAKPARKFPDGDPSDAWTVAELRAFADAAGLEVGAARSKAQILEVIDPPQAAGNEADDD